MHTASHKERACFGRVVYAKSITLRNGRPHARLAQEARKMLTVGVECSVIWVYLTPSSITVSLTTLAFASCEQQPPHLSPAS